MFNSCHNCPKEKKYIGCHAECKDYLREKEEYQLWKESIEQEKRKYLGCYTTGRYKVKRA